MWNLEEGFGCSVSSPTKSLWKTFSQTQSPLFERNSANCTAQVDVKDQEVQILQHELEMRTQELGGKN